MASMFDESSIDHGTRMMYRSAHVYLLLTALTNLVMGAYLERHDRIVMRIIQFVGSIMLLLSPLGFLVAFFVEPAPERLDRPITLISVVFAILGVSLLTFGRISLNSKQ